MLHDISVLLPVDRPAGALIDCAVSVAGLFEAHLDGIACVYQALNPMLASEAAAVVMAAEYETSVTQAAVVLDQFEIATRRLGIPHDARSTFDVSYAATRTVTQMSRLYDLNIVAQPDRSNPSQADFLSEAVLFGSGAAGADDSLHHPCSHQDRSRADLLGRRPTGRAGGARRHALSSQGENDRHCRGQREEDAGGEASSTASIAHLARRDLSATPYRVAAEGPNIHNAILSLAADNDTDLIVMGGYGHSRLREFILGGTTRGMFELLTVPGTISLELN